MVDVGNESSAVDGDRDVAFAGSSWFQRTNAHVAHLQGQLNKFLKMREAAPGGISAPDIEVVKKIRTHLEAARNALRRRGVKGWFWRMSGASADRALANMHEAEVALLRIAPDEELPNKRLYVLSHARLHLPKDDVCLQHLEAAEKAPAGELRELAAITLHSAYQAEEAERARVRSFIRIVVVAAGALGVMAVGLGVWAALDLAVAQRFCFPPDKNATGPDAVMACPLGDAPTSGSVFFLEFIGMCAAAIAGAVSLRDVRGTSGPYHVATGLIVLRLPVGALVAAAGLLLMSGEFFPGLTSLNTSTQIVAWAFAFGILQESVTRAVDRQGQSLLDRVKGPGSRPAAANPGPAPDRL
ncbi:hypothetical protein ABZ915_03495 [Streptomyces sp. NPDC046915]|uniref:hypothetical protein n=1 Tax=Streptomyces sp. NPDC046915 TaxID=3155257 RepID=UPI0033ED8BDC